MINGESIISSFDDTLTLLEWLKFVEKALKESVLKNVETNTIDGKTKFIFNFADGTKIETAYIQTKGDTGAAGLQGPKGDTGADGVSITGIETVGDEFVGDETHTTLRAHYSNNTTDEFVIAARNGKDGAAKIYLHMITLKARGGTKKFNFNLFSLRGTPYTISEIIGLLNKAALSETNTICGTYISATNVQFAALWSATYDASVNTSQFKIFTSNGSVDINYASSVDVVTGL